MPRYGNVQRALHRMVFQLGNGVGLATMCLRFGILPRFLPEDVFARLREAVAGQIAQLKSPVPGWAPSTRRSALTTRKRDGCAGRKAPAATTICWCWMESKQGGGDKPLPRSSTFLPIFPTERRRQYIASPMPPNRARLTSRPLFDAYSGPYHHCGRVEQHGTSVLQREHTQLCMCGRKVAYR